MKVAEWMSPDPLTVGPEDSVATARSLLVSHGIRHLPVVDGDLLVGLISDRDVCGDRPDSLPSERLVESVMSSPAATIRQEDAIQEAGRLMVSRRFGALPVVDADNRLIGIITTTDCLLAMLELAAREEPLLLD